MKGVGRKRRVGVMCREMWDACRGSIGREFTRPWKRDRTGGRQVLSGVRGTDVLERLRNVNVRFGGGCSGETPEQEMNEPAQMEVGWLGG